MKIALLKMKQRCSAGGKRGGENAAIHRRHGGGAWLSARAAAHRNTGGVSAASKTANELRRALSAGV